MATENDFRKLFLNTRRNLARESSFSINDEKELHLCLIYACLEAARSYRPLEPVCFSSVVGLKIIPQKTWNDISYLLNQARNHKDNPSVITSMLELVPDDNVVSKSDRGYANLHSLRKKTGSYFTPLNVARFMSSVLISEYFSKNFEHNDDLSILDPSVGGGIFIDTIFSELELKGFNDQGIIDSLYAVDRDSNSLDFTIAMLKVKSPDAEIPENHFLRGDFLLDELNHPDSGYNLIIGNPPYISYYSRGAHEDIESIKTRLKSRYQKSAGGSLNTFLHFIVRGIELLADDGMLCFIVPDRLLWNRRYRVIRAFILNEASPISIFTANDNVFPGAVVNNAVIILQKGRSEHDDCIMGEMSFTESGIIETKNNRAVKPLDFTRDNQIRFIKHDKLIEVIEKDSIPLGDIAHIRDGINPAFSDFRREIVADFLEDNTFKPLIEGADIKPFFLKPHRLYIKYDPCMMTKELQKRGVSFREEWIFISPLKLVNRQTAGRLIFALDEHKHYTLNSVHNTIIREEFLKEFSIGNEIALKESSNDPEQILILFLLALMNSRLMNYYYQSVTHEVSSQFPQVHIADLKELPIRLPEFKIILKIAEKSHEILIRGQSEFAELERIDSLIFDIYEINENDRVRILNDTGKEWRM